MSEHWVAGYGREGFASDHAAVFKDEEAAREWQLEFLEKVRVADRGETMTLEEEIRAASLEIEDGYGATGNVAGRYHWVAECDRSECVWPQEQCRSASKAIAGMAS